MRLRRVRTSAHDHRDNPDERAPGDGSVYVYNPAERMHSHWESVKGDGQWRPTYPIRPVFARSVDFAGRNRRLPDPG